MTGRLLGVAFGLGAVWLVAPVAGQQDDARWQQQCEQEQGNRDRARVCEVRRLGFKPADRRLHIDPDQNGGVEITAWDRDSVAISARMQAWSRSAEEATRLLRSVEIEARGSRIAVHAPDGGRREGVGVTLVIMLPRQSDLEVQTTNGPLEVDGVSGDLDLSTVNGPLSLARLSGRVRARAQNGPLSVELQGSTWTGEGLDAETVNGPVDLTIPEGYNAELETGTIHGPTDFQMPITVTLKGRQASRIHTMLGKGGPPIRVVTTNGPLTLRPAR